MWAEGSPRPVSSPLPALLFALPSLYFCPCPGLPSCAPLCLFLFVSFFLGPFVYIRPLRSPPSFMSPSPCVSFCSCLSFLLTAFLSPVRSLSLPPCFSPISASSPILPLPPLLPSLSPVCPIIQLTWEEIMHLGQEGNTAGLGGWLRPGGGESRASGQESTARVQARDGKV